jgi:hypothetical protein
MPARRVALYVRAGGSNTPRGWLSFAVFSKGLLDKLDVIECFEHPGQRLLVGEVLEKQKQIYVALGVPPPGSL